MPKIDLKPNSPEFASAAPKTKARCCDMPGCAQDATHKAPKDRGLNEYYHFCIDHVSEYNRAWNYFSGMAPGDIEDHIVRDMTGDRPTWRYDSYAKMEEQLYTKAWKTRHFTEQEPPKKEEYGAFTNRNTPEYEAMAIMGLEPPLSLEVIKLRYRELAKKHHPDLNKNDPKAEELLKRINMAYTVLKLAHDKFDDLPQREK